MMEWQPIDTAPKDGSRVELMNAGSGLRDAGYWHDYGGRSLTGLPGEWSQDDGNGDMTHWRWPHEQNALDAARYRKYRSLVIAALAEPVTTAEFDADLDAASSFCGQRRTVEPDNAEMDARIDNEMKEPK